VRRFDGTRLILILLVVLLAACHAAAPSPPDRQPQLDQLTQQLRSMPGVTAASNKLVKDTTDGQANLHVYVEVADDITGDHLAAVVAGYLDNLRAVNYSPYQTNFQARQGFNYFAIDSDHEVVTNGDQIQREARIWVAMLHEFPGATVYFRPTIVLGKARSASRPQRTPSAGTVTVPVDADYTAVAATFTTLAAKFPDLGSGDWKVIAGKSLGGGIESFGRLPNAAEIDVWNKLNADQSIPHLDVMAIDSPSTAAPLWVSEGPQSPDLDVRIRLSQQHLPIVATLPAPVFYTASDQLERRVNNEGKAVGPVSVTVGGCTQRAYQPSPAEQALIDQYEKCGR
jgi:hypothetical protein